MNLPANIPQFTYTQKNTYVKETSKRIWGAKTEGIQKGDVRHGIILGFEVFKGTKNIILKCFEEKGGIISIAGCKSLSKQLHVEQDYPFINLIYNVGDVVAVTFIDSFIANKGDAIGKLIAIYSVREVGPYTLTQEDIADIQQYQAEQARVTPMAQYQQIPQAPMANPYNPYVQQAPVQQSFAQPTWQAPVAQQQSFVQPTQQPAWQPQASSQQIDVPIFAPKVGFKKSQNDDTFDV